jgi:hypothetical protein
MVLVTQVQPVNAIHLAPETGTRRIILKVTWRPSEKEANETRWGKISAESSLFFQWCSFFIVRRSSRFQTAVL